MVQSVVTALTIFGTIFGTIIGTVFGTVFGMVPRKICNQALSSKKSKLGTPFEENIPVRAKHLKEQDIPLIGQGKNIKPETKPKVENTLLSIDKNGRVLACRTCERCMRDDCGQCTACRDKKKFGGKGTTKKKCSKRFCPLQEALRAKLKSSKESRL